MTETTLQRRDMAPPVRFRHDIARIAQGHYGDAAQTTDGARIVSRFAMAFATAARAARNPDAFYSANPASVAACAALSLDTGLLPGGAMPAVWLIPRGGELQWMPSHRGLVQLAQTAGFQVSAVPVCIGDEIEIREGQIVKLTTDPDSWAQSLSDLRGVAVFVTRTSTGERFASWWLPRAAIEQRARVKGAGPVWRSWPVEMALKTAIKYGFARGYVPCESVALDAALSADAAAERVEVTVNATPPPSSPAAAIEVPAGEEEALPIEIEAAALLEEHSADKGALLDRYAALHGGEFPAGDMTDLEVAVAVLRAGGAL